MAACLVGQTCGTDLVPQPLLLTSIPTRSSSNICAHCNKAWASRLGLCLFTPAIWGDEITNISAIRGLGSAESGTAPSSALRSLERTVTLTAGTESLGLAPSQAACAPMALSVTPHRPASAAHPRCAAAWSRPMIRTLKAVPRPRIAVRAHYDSSWGFGSEVPAKAVFAHPGIPHTLIENVEVMDARDAMETCSTLSGEAKDACYMLFGCDPRGVEQYLTVVETLESALQQEPDPLENCWRQSK